MVGPIKIKTDPNDKKIKRAMLGSYNVLKDVRLDPDAQYLIEFIGLNDRGSDVGLGWTWLLPF